MTTQPPLFQFIDVPNFEVRARRASFARGVAEFSPLAHDARHFSDCRSVPPVVGILILADVVVQSQAHSYKRGRVKRDNRCANPLPTNYASRPPAENPDLVFPFGWLAGKQGIWPFPMLLFPSEALLGS